MRSMQEYSFRKEGLVVLLVPSTLLSICFFGNLFLLLTTGTFFARSDCPAATVCLPIYELLFLAFTIPALAILLLVITGIFRRNGSNRCSCLAGPFAYAGATLGLGLSSFLFLILTSEPVRELSSLRPYPPLIGPITTGIFQHLFVPALTFVFAFGIIGALIAQYRYPFTRVEIIGQVLMISLGAGLMIPALSYRLSDLHIPQEHHEYHRVRQTASSATRAIGECMLEDSTLFGVYPDTWNRRDWTSFSSPCIKKLAKSIRTAAADHWTEIYVDTDFDGILPVAESSCDSDAFGSSRMKIAQLVERPLSSLIPFLKPPNRPWFPTMEAKWESAWFNNADPPRLPSYLTKQRVVPFTVGNDKPPILTVSLTIAPDSSAPNFHRDLHCSAAAQIPLPVGKIAEIQHQLASTHGVDAESLLALVSRLPPQTGATLGFEALYFAQSEEVTLRRVALAILARQVKSGQSECFLARLASRYHDTDFFRTASARVHSNISLRAITGGSSSACRDARR